MQHNIDDIDESTFDILSAQGLHRLVAERWEMPKSNQLVHGFLFFSFGPHLQRQNSHSQFQRVGRIVSISSQAIPFHGSFL